MSKRSPPFSCCATSVARSPVELGEHGIGGVRLLLVREVEAGHEPLEQPAREHADDDVRRLQTPVGRRHPARLDRDDLVPPVVDRARAAEAPEAVLEGTSSRVSAGCA